MRKIEVSFLGLELFGWKAAGVRIPHFYWYEGDSGVIFTFSKGVENTCGFPKIALPVKEMKTGQKGMETKEVNFAMKRTAGDLSHFLFVRKR